jgi:uncharacterized protein (TIGR02145 family)
MYSTMTLEDTRNNQLYRVRKMPDDKCWMIDNLKLELSTGMELKPADSNVSSPTTVTLATGGLIGNFTTSGFLTATNTDSFGTNYDNFNAWRQANPNDPSQPGTESCVAGNFVDPASTTGCGYLYNWYTATASSGTNTSGDTTDSHVTGSICPAGWRLPRGGVATTNENEFAMLNAKMNDPNAISGTTSDSTTYAKNWWHTGLFTGPRSGDYFFGFRHQGYYGSFWSSSASSSYFALGLIYYYSGVYPGMVNSDKPNGFAVRCLV